VEPDDGFRPDPEIQKLAAEFKALAAAYPPPDLQEWNADWQWMYDRSDDNTLDPLMKYMDGYVAVYNREIVGSGPDFLRLQVELSRKFGVHPERFVIKAMC
jgi:hypothetical protein